MKAPISIKLDIVYDRENPAYVGIVRSGEPLGNHKIEDSKHVKSLRDLLIILSNYCGNRLTQ